MNRLHKYTLILILVLLFNPRLNVKAISSFTKYLANPILIPTQNSWDQASIRDANVLYENGIYKMWYAGSNGNIWQIGYATSTDGINWIKNPANPVLKTNLLDVNETNLFVPRIIHDGEIYKMWYTATSNYNCCWKIRYATSSDGINWIRQGPINIPKQPYEIGVYVSQTVVKTNPDYKMWYTTNNGISWQIAYATSSDGINWDPYVSNPVIYPTTPWEGTHSDGAHVNFDGNKFEIYYQGYNIYGRANISYAVSLDGINWTKPIDKNPVIEASDFGFDSSHTSTPHLLKHISGVQWLYYMGLGNNSSTWQIGLAADGPITTEQPTPTPTTPTPTPTPTPSPTPVPVTKVVVIPGFGGSMNVDAIQNCKIDNYSGDWGPYFLGEQTYNAILNSIGNAGYTALPFYYDWRKQPVNLASKLDEFIQQNTIPNEKVYMVGHSMGGLVARAYLELTKNQTKVSKLMTVGTPHKGTVISYPAWAAGTMREGSDMKIALMAQRGFCMLRKDSKITNREIVQTIIPSIQTFLPTFDYLRILPGNYLKPVSLLNYQNPWLKNDPLFLPDYYGVTIGALRGSGLKTPYLLNVKPPNPSDISKGQWLDGRLTSWEETITGDGLVTEQSASILDAYNKTIKREHGELIYSGDGIREIFSFLGLPTEAIQANANISKPETALIVSGIDIKISLIKSGETIQQAADGINGIINPTAGTYSIKIEGGDDSTLIDIIVIGKNDSVQTKRLTKKEITSGETITIDETTQFR